MKRVQFSVVYPDRLAHPLHRQIAGASPVSRAELLTWSPTGNPTTLLWCDGDRAATEAALGGIDSLVASTVVPDLDGTYAFLRQDDYEFPDAILALVADSAVAFVPPVAFEETGEVRFEAVGEATALGEFQRALSDLGDVTVERVHEFERRRTPADLTDRQQAALDAAVEVGYYEVPREGSVADVARELDCSTSTAGELVRKAEAAVIRNYTDAR